MTRGKVPIDGYNLKIKIGKSKIIDLKKLAESSCSTEDAVYSRLRRRITYSKRTGQDLISRKNGRYVTIFRVG